MTEKQGAEVGKAAFQVFGGKGTGGSFIGADDIAANVGAFNKIGANSITAGHIVAGLVTTDEVAMGTGGAGLFSLVSILMDRIKGLSERVTQLEKADCG